jgi:hypothetical protein
MPPLAVDLVNGQLLACQHVGHGVGHGAGQRRALADQQFAFGRRHAGACTQGGGGQAAQQGAPGQREVVGQVIHRRLFVVGGRWAHCAHRLTLRSGPKVAALPGVCQYLALPASGKPCAAQLSIAGCSDGSFSRCVSASGPGCVAIGAASGPVWRLKLRGKVALRIEAAGQRDVQHAGAAAGLPAAPTTAAGRPVPCAGPRCTGAA